jgi:hypothetical protein
MLWSFAVRSLERQTRSHDQRTPSLPPGYGCQIWPSGRRSKRRMPSADKVHRRLEPGAHHVIDVVVGITGMSRCVGFVDHDAGRFSLRQMTLFRLAFIEHRFRRDERETLTSARVIIMVRVEEIGPNGVPEKAHRNEDCSSPNTQLVSMTPRGRGWPAVRTQTRVSISARAARCGQGHTRRYPQRGKR